MIKKLAILISAMATLGGATAFAARCFGVYETVCDTCSDSEGNTWDCNCRKVRVDTECPGD